MYRLVDQSDDPARSECNEYLDDMGDRDSLYLDTISMTSEFPNRKSLSMSRQTVYHSAEDLNQSASVSPRSSVSPPSSSGAASSDGVAGLAASAADFLDRMRSTSHAELERLNGGHGEDGPAASSGGGRLANGILINGPTKLHIDEVSERLLYMSNNKTVTYSEWKSRTWRRFQDGERSVDFVLAYPSSDPYPRNADRRRTFEANLEHEGLQLEREQTQHIHFVKIHAPQEVLCRYCEILKMKMPIKRVTEQEQILRDEFQLVEQIKSFCGRPFDFVDLDRQVFPDEEYRLKYEYSRNYSYLFDEEKPGFFTPTVSISVVHFILERMRFSDDDETSNNVGIEKLLAEGVYEAAYPLHDGDCQTPDSIRHLLFTEWALVNKWIKHQPLDHIKEYFGVKVALYFAWLGFYTHMLIPASVVGIICFLFGLFTLNSNNISKEVCDVNNTIYMCPQCDKTCDYWLMSDTCAYSKISHVFDNSFTIAFACFMSFWAVLYLELWKRYSAKLLHKWGMSDFSSQAEHPRPEYLSRLKSAQKKRFNVIHRVLEPHVPFWKVKFPIYLMSCSFVLFFMCLAVAAVFGIVIYRMSRTVLIPSDPSQPYTMFVLPATAACINLVIIMILNYAYDHLAVVLTNLEYRRTQTEYDESLTLKIYLFQFVNYYSSIFYIAFLKGKFVGYPAKYNRIFNFRQEECSPGGCLMELCIQLVIIMIGKQAMNAALEMFFPYITRRYYEWQRTRTNKDDPDATPDLIACNQWTNDYKLLAWSSRGLFDEYLEMIIQFGFVTIFVVAFPLAPLFALVNNVFEMRLDAQKFLKYYRRPVPSRVKDIGVWFNIMAILSRISTATSAFIIAFSSNFIPRLLYMMTNHTDQGYLNFTLSAFNTTDFPVGSAPDNSTYGNVTTCYYTDYRNPPSADKAVRYKRTITYWHILVARLAFLVVFENAMGLVQMFVAWAIPDVPRKLSDRIKREDYLTRELIIEQEKMLTNTAGDRTSQLHHDLQNDLFMGAADGSASELRQRATDSVRVSMESVKSVHDTAV